MENEQLVDLSEVEIDNSLNKAERIHSFIEKVGNPYAFRVGNVEVEISFEADGESLQDKMERYFETIVFWEEAWKRLKDLIILKQDKS